MFQALETITVNITQILLFRAVPVVVEHELGPHCGLIGARRAARCSEPLFLWQVSAGSPQPPEICILRQYLPAHWPTSLQHETSQYFFLGKKKSRSIAPMHGQSRGEFKLGTSLVTCYAIERVNDRLSLDYNLTSQRDIFLHILPKTVLLTCRLQSWCQIQAGSFPSTDQRLQGNRHGYIPLKHKTTASDFSWMSDIWVSVIILLTFGE